MNIFDILKTFPAIWATFGLIVGGGAMFWVAQKFGPIRNQAQQELVASYQRQVTAANELAKLQVDSHMVQLQMQKDHWTEELMKLESSREEYKAQLHAVRNELNARDLKIQELEMRPSVELLQSEQQAFYKEMVASMAAISVTLKSHDESIPRRIQEFQKPILEACTDISHGMSQLVKTLQNCGTLPKKAAA